MGLYPGLDALGRETKYNENEPNAWTGRKRKVALACPKCLVDECLWQEVRVSGWWSIEARNEDGKVILKPTKAGTPDREVDWTSGVDAYDEVGCGKCGWSGRSKDLVPAPTLQETEIDPDQQRISI